LARLYREAPLNAIWEGSGNVMCLDVLRALGREAEQARAVLDAVGREATGLAGTAAAASFIAATLKEADGETNARAAVERLALLAAAAALAEGAPAEVADTFARARLERARGSTYGTARLDP